MKQQALAHCRPVGRRRGHDHGARALPAALRRTARVIDRLRRWLAGPRGELRDVERAIRKMAETQRDAAAALEARINAVAGEAAQQASAKDAIETLHAIRSLHRSLRRDPEAKLYKALDAIAKGSGPIVVGPWTGEVGFEVLYWIPFVRWFQSRGGVAQWYGVEGARYVDILSIVAPDVFRARTDPVEHKQRTVLPFDREIAESVARALTLEDPPLLHPELMYRVLGPFWRDEEGLGLIDRFTMHRRLPPLDHPAVGPLPAEYVAVRFYFSDCFPDIPDNRERVRSLVCGLSRRTPVVMLNPGLQMDDHADYSPPDAANVLRLHANVPAEENLAVQSAVLSRARGFVGTYGGYSYLAPFYGVPSVAFYSHRTFKLHHLHLAQRVFERLGGAGVTAVDTAAGPLIHAATAAFA